MTNIGEYSQKVLDHFRNPRNVGTIENADGIGTVGNSTCGDLDVVYLKIEKETDIIKEVKFQAFGCGANIASMSMLTLLAQDKKIDEAKKITRLDIAEELDGLVPVKVHCSLLAAEALRSAIDDYNKRKDGIQK